MPTPLSHDLRYRFRQAIEAGLSGREAARRLMVSAPTDARLARKVRRGEPLSLAGCGRPPGSGKLAAVLPAGRVISAIRVLRSWSTGTGREPLQITRSASESPAVLRAPASSGR